MKTGNRNFILVLCLLLMAAAQCTNKQVTGGASGTEISACVVSGTVVDSSDNPVQGCIMRLRPHSYIAGVDSLSPGIVQDDTTNAAGRFSFDSVPRGRQYMIEAVFNDSLGQSTEFEVDSVDSMNVISPPIIIKSMATVFGNNVPLAPQGTGAAHPSVQAIGFERSVPIDSMGHFEMKVPQGWCRLHFQGIDTNRFQSPTILYCSPGKQYTIMPPQFFFPCTTLTCEMSYVQEILDSNYLQSLTPDSITVVQAGHVTELHLRGKGIHVLPMSVCWLGRLRVLDIGKNFLYELPPAIGSLWSLTTLRADSNSLWIIPSSIGMLLSLRELDLSYNRLQSLPGPITSLMPMVLNLDGNMLCDMGDFTGQWADRYAFGWRERQNCWY